MPTFSVATTYNPMSAETQAEMEAKQKFIGENQEQVRMGKEVPGFKEAVAWIKATKKAHINKEATALKTEEIIKWLKEQRDTPEYKALNEAYLKECDRQKGFW
jgi:hypothetical protein